MTSFHSNKKNCNPDIPPLFFEVLVEMKLLNFIEDMSRDQLDQSKADKPLGKPEHLFSPFTGTFSQKCPSSLT